MRYLDLFSGISAPTVAWKDLGWEAVAYAEIDKFASVVLSHHYPTVPNLGDVTQADWESVKNIDVLVGGSPCQSFSVSGKRESLADDRGNLALEFCHIANKTNPIFTLYENVPGILSAKDNPFGKLLALLVGAEFPLSSPRGGHKWEKCGFVVGQRRSVAWRTLCASNFGVPQRRRRVFVLAYDYRAGVRIFGKTPNADIRRLAGIPGAILFEPESLPRDIEESAQSRQDSAKNATRCSESEGSQNTLTRKPDHSSVNQDTLTQNPTNGRYSVEAESKNPTNGRYFVKAESKNPLRNSRVAPAEFLAFSCVDHAQDIGSVSPTLRSLSGKRQSAGGQVAIYKVTMGDANGVRQDRPNGGIYINETISSSTITCSGSESDIVAFRTGQMGANGIGVTTDGKSHTVACSSVEGVTSENLPPRRLSTVECLRLQGFPDDYLDISYNGKPASKTQKYKAIGNSMAVPVVRWIGERIEKVVSAFV